MVFVLTDQDAVARRGVHAVGAIAIPPTSKLAAIAAPPFVLGLLHFIIFISSSRICCFATHKGISLIQCGDN